MTLEDKIHHRASQDYSEVLSFNEHHLVVFFMILATDIRLVLGPGTKSTFHPVLLSFSSSKVAISMFPCFSIGSGVATELEFLVLA